MTVGTPWKKSTPSKIWGHLKPSLFENLIGGSTTSPTISSIVDEIFIELKIYHAFMPSKDFLFSFFPFPSLFSPMIFQNLKNYCILYIYIYIYIYIWCVIDMVKCQWTAVVLLSESTKEQSAQTTDGIDLWALHACPYFLEQTLYRPCTLFSPMIFQNLKNYCTLYIYIYVYIYIDR